MVPGKEGGVPLGPSQPAHAAQADQERLATYTPSDGAHCAATPSSRWVHVLARPLFRPTRGLSSPTHLLIWYQQVKSSFQHWLRLGICRENVESFKFPIRILHCSWCVRGACPGHHYCLLTAGSRAWRALPWCRKVFWDVPLVPWDGFPGCPQYSLRPEQGGVNHTRDIGVMVCLRW